MNLAIIPARGGSKGIPGKNIKLLGGRPLINWTVTAALDTPEIDKVVVTSDSDDVLLSVQRGVHQHEKRLWLMKRPLCLGADSVQLDEVYRFTLRELNSFGLKPDVLILLAPTSPFRTTAHIRQALNRPLGEGTLFSVYLDRRFHWSAHTINGEGSPLACKPEHHDPHNRKGRQWIDDRTGWLYCESGGLYIIKAESLLETGSQRIPPFTLFPMNPLHCVEIDEPLDWEWAEFLLSRYGHPDEFPEAA